MKKIIYLITLVFMFSGIQTFAAPHGGQPPMRGGVAMAHRHHGPSFHISVGRPLPPPMYRPYRPIIRPYYPAMYYSPYTTYSYTYYYEPTVTEVPISQTVVVRDNYAGINTAANVINAAANVATAIRVLSW